jgi:AraC-like DNA-binding protein
MSSIKTKEIEPSTLFESLFNAIRLRLLFHGLIKGKRKWHDTAGHPMNRLYFFMKGSAKVTYEKKTFELKPGNVYLFPLNRAYRFDGNLGFEKWFFDFRAEVFPGWDLFDQTPTGLQIPIAGDPVIERFLNGFKSKTVESLVEATGLLWQILSRFVHLDFSEFQKRTLLAVRYAPLKSVVEGASYSEIHLGQIAKNMGLKLPALSKKFKADTGITLDRYVAHEFIERAKIQLLLGDLKIREISLSLGFNSEFYFSRFFSRHTGRSPKAYRDQHHLRQGFLESKKT